MEKLQIQDPVEIEHTHDIPRPTRKPKIATSEKFSLGYETLTTMSELDSEVKFFPIHDII